ncbi:MAG: PIG-L family deacetylase, partial [Candidatus Heimdallarchaeota archaeon]
MIPLIQKSDKLDVMVVAAHPDDAEIGCGAILAKLSKEEKSVGIIDLTDGEPTPHTSSRDERLEEAKNSGLKLGLVIREILELPNRKLFDNFESRIALADRIRKYRPKILISQYGKTPHDSPDHYQAQLITEGALFYARLSKWEEFFSLPVHRVWNLFYYITLR